MEVLVLVVVVAVGLGLWFWLSRRQAEPGGEGSGDPIDRARDPEELREAWNRLEARGYSRDGLTFARVLEKKRELGERLRPDESELIDRAEKVRARAQDLPPIRGRTNKR